MPMLAFCTLLVGTVMALVSPGPILFRHPRIGLRGRRFMCYKFRTMRVGAGSKIRRGDCDRLVRASAPMVRMEAGGDSRLIPGGRLMRASGLAGLPQFINVLRGEMSVVGPQSCLPDEYEKCLPRERARWNAMPGLTGLWQVSGRTQTTFDEMVRLDLDYAENRSFWLDVTIIARSAPALLRQLRDARRRPELVTQTGKSERAEV